MSKVVYIGGTFDLLHVGHVRLFQRAAGLGKVVVSVNPDEFVERYKRKPLMSLAERQEMVAACRFVDQVITNWGCEDSKPAILTVNPDIIIHGDDWEAERFLEVMGLTPEWVAEQKIQIVSLPYTPGISTSNIIERCAPHW
jgi:glycerol-3-phosphate cytidylyltransferase